MGNTLNESKLDPLQKKKRFRKKAKLEAKILKKSNNFVENALLAKDFLHLVRTEWRNLNPIDLECSHDSKDGSGEDTPQIQKNTHLSHKVDLDTGSKKSHDSDSNLCLQERESFCQINADKETANAMLFEEEQIQGFPPLEYLLSPNVNIGYVLNDPTKANTKRMQKLHILVKALMKEQVMIQEKILSFVAIFLYHVAQLYIFFLHLSSFV